MKRVLLSLFAGAIVLSMISPASSDDHRVEDPQGDGSGSVDLLAGSHGHRSVEGGAGFRERLGGSVIVHDIESADDWTFDGDSLELRLTSGRWRVARRLFVNANPDGSLTGVVFTRDLFRGYANVYRLNATTLRIEFPESVLGEDVRSYRWRIFGTGAADDCGEGFDCEIPLPDRLPDLGSVLHEGLGRFNP